MKSADELRQKIEQLGQWYHKIDLGDGVVTPGYDFEYIWDMIRESRHYMDYNSKKVLDLASFDGMWAFEAERLGAELVVATDCYYETFKKLMLCKEVLGSDVIPYYNISPYYLYQRLDVYLQENWGAQRPYDRLFDIVQHLGLLYHLRDPLLSLSQSRSVIQTGGLLLIESAIIANEESSIMVFNGIPPGEQRISNDITTWWAPSLPCLKEMLKASLFEPIESSVRVLNSKSETIKPSEEPNDKSNNSNLKISRASLVAKAVPGSELDKDYYRELTRTYRNPGLNTELTRARF